jgi:hypothetical protein
VAGLDGCGSGDYNGDNVVETIPSNGFLTVDASCNQGTSYTYSVVNICSCNPNCCIAPFSQYAPNLSAPNGTIVSCLGQTWYSTTHAGSTCAGYCQNLTGSALYR